MAEMAGGPVKRSITIAGHRTSVSLEAEFWTALAEAAARRGLPVAALVAQIDAARGRRNLSSAVRVFLLSEAMERGSAP
jgi:predicted DNA-binding ribbon-helix-helix protein